jgi:hypothetical protein
MTHTIHIHTSQAELPLPLQAAQQRAGRHLQVCLYAVCCMPMPITVFLTYLHTTYVSFIPYTYTYTHMNI